MKFFYLSRFLLFIILFKFFLLVPVNVFSSLDSSNKNLDEPKDAIIISGLSLLYSGKWEEAISCFKQLDEIDPESSEGTFFEASALECMMDDYRSQDPELEQRLRIALEEVIKKTQKVVVRRPTARNYMFWGAGYGLRGMRQGKLGHWWNTFISSISSIRYMRMAVEIDPDLYDCYYGLVLYNYWVSEKLRRFLPFFDKRKKGIQQLIYAQKGIFSPIPRKIALFRIYIEEEKYDEIIELVKGILSAYPDSLIARWQYGMALIRSKQWEKTIKHYQWILIYLKPVKIKGPEASIEAWYYLALSYHNLREYQKAKELLEKILS